MTTITDRAPPQAVAMEEALLSCIMQEPSTIGSEVLDLFRNANPFTVNEHAAIYHTWAASNDRLSFDMITIADVLTAKNNSIDWFSKIREVCNKLPHTVDWQNYLTAVRNCYIRRQLIRFSQVFQDRMYLDGVDIESELSRYKDALSEAMTVNGEKAVDINRQIEEHVSMMNDPDNSIRFGLDKLDSYVRLFPGETVVIASRPSVGKSTFAATMLRNMAESGVPCMMFSLEMPVPQVIARMLAGALHADSRYILNRLGEPAVAECYKHIISLPIRYCDKAGMRISEIERRIRRAHSESGIKVVFLDQMTLIKGDSDRVKRNEQVSDISKRIKALCQELGIIPIIFTQIRRTEGRDPCLDDLKESGAMEEDASTVIIPHRGVVLTQEELQRVERGGAVRVGVAIEKNRHGATGFVSMKMVLRSCLLKDEHVEDSDIEEHITKEQEDGSL